MRLKTDTAYWADYQNAEEIGGFGVPWPPFGFNSGMSMEDVSREEAAKLGLPVAGVSPRENTFNEQLKASVTIMAERCVPGPL